MAEISMDAPAVFAFSDSEMSAERDALLLECGTYPDKGLTVTEADLDAIVERFSADGAPVKVEHMDTPLDPLGRVQKIWRDGSVLMAKLLFPPDMASFLRRRGVQKLSVGLSREAVGLGCSLSLAEVSLVLKPRVQAAAMFGEAEGDPSRRASPPPSPVREGLSEPNPAASSDPSLGRKGEDVKDAEIARLSAALSAREVEGQVQKLKSEGRIVPATEPLARALLSVPSSALITLAEGDAALPVREVFLSYLQAQPPTVEFRETAGMGGEKGAEAGKRSHHHPEGDHRALTADEEAFLRKLGLDPADVQHMMRHDRLPSGHMGTKGN